MAGTNFSSGLYSMGVPVFGAGVPLTFGKVFFVDQDNGVDSDGADSGRSIERAFKTISWAYGKCTTNKDDVIVLSSNAGHSQTAMLTLDKNRVHFVAANFYPRANTQRSRITMANTTAATDLAQVKITGSYHTFEGIKFDQSNTNANLLHGVVVGGEGNIFINCSFSNRANLTTANRADLVEQGTSSRYIDCEIGQDSSISSRAGPLLMDASVGALAVSTSPEFVNCKFVGWKSADVAFVTIVAATDLYGYCQMERPIFIQKIAEGTGATITDVFNPPASITNGILIMRDPVAVNFTNLASAAGAGNAGIYVIGPVPTAATSGLPVQAA